MKFSIIHGRYYLIRKLGEGGYGEVWLAEERVKGHKVATVAVKCLGNRMGLTEIKTLAKLDSRYILGYKATLEQKGQLYLVTEYADGGTALDRSLEYLNGLPERKAREIILRVSKALEYLHRKGFIHRDVKPENILFIKNKAKLGDLGTVSRLRGRSVIHTGTQTLEFTAPEMLNGRVSPASDIYSLGITAFYLLFGDFPFAVITPPAIERWHKQGTYKLPKKMPEYWASFFKGCLAKNPGSRLTAAEIIDLLENPDIRRTKDRQKPKTVSSLPSPPVSIYDLGHDEIVIAIRCIFASFGPGRWIPIPRALKEVATALGYQRISPTIKPILIASMQEAILRKIILRHNQQYVIYRRSIKEYTPDELGRLLRRSMTRTWWIQDEAIYYATRYLGYKRTGPLIRQNFEAIIRNRIRKKEIEFDKKDRRWIRWVK